MKLSQILHDAAGAAGRFFKAPEGFAQILGQPVYPLPAYLTLRHLEKHQSPDACPCNRSGPSPEIGDEMEDGTIYAGISPDTGNAMYTTPRDAPLTYTFDQARRYSAKSDEYGHRDWRVPTKGELNLLFQNRAAIGGFDESGSCPAGWYWSSTPNNYNGAWTQRFSNGLQNHYDLRSSGASLRYVRG